MQFTNDYVVPTLLIPCVSGSAASYLALAAKARTRALRID